MVYGNIRDIYIIIPLASFLRKTFQNETARANSLFSFKAALMLMDFL